MTIEEFAMKSRAILTKLENPEDVAAVIDEMISAYTERDGAAVAAETKVSELTAKTERLQAANMELYLRTGVKSDTDELSGTEQEKGTDFAELFDGNGELK